MKLTLDESTAPILEQTTNTLAFTDSVSNKTSPMKRKKHEY
jgi:hypothetical protein